MGEQPVLWAQPILEALDRHGVRYIVIGALGALLLGSPLRTADLDICPEPGEENLTRLAAALRELGAKEWDPRKDEVFERDFDAEMLAIDDTWILVTDHGPLDLVFAPAGTGGFRDLKRGAGTVVVGDAVVPVASLADIIRSKEAAGREKDRLQLVTLRKLLERIEEQRRQK